MRNSSILHPATYTWQISEERNGPHSRRGCQFLILKGQQVLAPASGRILVKFASLARIDGQGSGRSKFSKEMMTRWSRRNMAGIFPQISNDIF